jgi:hypothetical protein
MPVLTSHTMRERDLGLGDGWHVGPLFVPQLIRPPVRQPGKEGQLHRAQTRRATPPWADREEIKKAYRYAKRLSAWMGELYVVDHIVPKINPIVCGLHVGWNLRVIHWLENAQKGAFTWPDMPMEQAVLF